jgi:F-type H+-transporting ATPase subunit delta
VDRVDGYAAAIFDLARTEEEPERIEQELLAVARAVESSNELRSTLTDPQLPAERKQGIVDDLIGGRASSLTGGIVSFIVGQGRIGDFPAIVDGFIERAAASRSKAVAEVRSAVALDPAVLERLERELSRVTGKQVEVKASVDPAVLGGVVAQVGDVVIDGSVARKMADLRRVMSS